MSLFTPCIFLSPCHVSPSLPSFISFFLCRARKDASVSMRCIKACQPNDFACDHDPIHLITHTSLSLPNFRDISGPEGKSRWKYGFLFKTLNSCFIGQIWHWWRRVTQKFFALHWFVGFLFCNELIYQGAHIDSHIKLSDVKRNLRYFSGFWALKCPKLCLFLLLTLSPRGGWWIVDGALFSNVYKRQANWDIY